MNERNDELTNVGVVNERQKWNLYVKRRQEDGLGDSYISPFQFQRSKHLDGNLGKLGNLQLKRSLPIGWFLLF